MIPADLVGATSARVLDYTIDSLVWLKNHLDNRTAPARLRELEVSLAAIALAIDHQMNGEAEAARAALKRADWSSKTADCW